MENAVGQQVELLHIKGVVVPVAAQGRHRPVGRQVEVEAATSPRRVGVARRGPRGVIRHARDVCRENPARCVIHRIVALITAAHAGCGPWRNDLARCCLR